MRENPLFETRIEIPQHATGEYAPAGDDAVRLAGTWHSELPLPANWGTALRTLTSAGEPLGVWVVASVPIAPGALVRAQAIGLLAWHDAGQTRHIIIATPKADQGVAHVKDWRDLSEEQRGMLEAGIGSDQQAKWQAAFQAVQVIRKARRMARLAQVGTGPEHATPVWQTSAGLGAFRESEGMAHTRAELSVRQLPLRYQEYIADMLAGDERIVMYVPRPALKGNRQGILGRQERQNDGLLVVTDQQVLWVVDALPPIEIVKSYGYIAKSCVLERVTGTEVREDGDLAYLSVDLASPVGNVERFSLSFPVASIGLLRRVVEYVEAFMPGRGVAALMRLACLPATETPLTDLIEENDDATRSLLGPWEDRLNAMLREGETLAAQAVVPAWSTEKPLLLAVTDQRVLYLNAHDQEPDVFPLSHITSADLSHSVMQSWLRLWVAGDEGVMPMQVEFPLVNLGAFTRAYVAIRQGLIAPAAFKRS
ncbi:MAG: inorganic diphosphatase [Anaerolineae bacterium]